MADFMQREKEFRKLNEQLDDDFKKSTLTKIEKFKETTKIRQSPCANLCYDTYRVKNMVNDRFATYTKEKPTNLNLMRKVGGGDYTATATTIATPTNKSYKSPATSPKTTKASYGNTFHHQHTRGRNLLKGNPCTRDFNERVRNSRNDEYEEQNATKTKISNTTRKATTTPKETLVVYKNEKFSCSSSLDDMIKKNIIEHIEAENENENKVRKTTTTENLIRSNQPSRAESIQPLESSTNVCGGSKSSQKFVNTSSLIRFLKSKVALLEENQAKNIEEMTQQKEAYAETIERHKSIAQQLDKALNRNAALSEQLEKVNKQIVESNRRCREQSQESLSLKKELECVKRELKQMTLNFSNLEKRYTRTKEETENVQKSFTSLRQGERDLKEHFRRDLDNKDAEIKYLKKQRSDLFTAYKKQLFLIDNLRQQTICMEQAKMIDFCEKEFSKILEWNLKP